jgi:hypothetical protein
VKNVDEKTVAVVTVFLTIAGLGVFAFVKVFFYPELSIPMGVFTGIGVGLLYQLRTIEKW